MSTKTDELMRLHDAVRSAWTTHEANAAEAALRSAIQEVVRDAERYRWLRDDGDSDWAICQWHGGDYYCEGRAAAVVDAAIDAAMQPEPPEAS